MQKISTKSIEPTHQVIPTMSEYYFDAIFLTLSSYTTCMAPMPSGFEPPSLPTPTLTPSLVSAAYRRAIRFGLYWRLEPEERAILYLTRKLREIRSPTLREVILKILEKIWPEKAQAIRAAELGVKVLMHKVNTALKIGAKFVVQALLNAAATLAPLLGYSYMNTPAFYRPKLDDLS